jgi:hypothetical protein
MENTQLPTTHQPDDIFGIAFDEATRVQIKQAAQWAKITALCAFIGYGVVLIVAIFSPRGYSFNNDAVVGGYIQTGNMLGVILSTALGTFINYFLYRFAAATAKGMDTMNPISTNDGFNSLRRYFKIYGILIIIVLSILVLVMLVGLLAGGLAGTR